MDSSHAQMVNLIWNIADDVLRDVFVRGQYRDVILPMVVLRRLDALLEPTKEAVEEEYAYQTKEGIKDEDGLKEAAGQNCPVPLRTLAENHEELVALESESHALSNHFLIESDVWNR